MWSEQLCQADSDGDGFTNGEELGDPYCQWQPGRNDMLARTSDIAHPGFADSVPSEEHRATPVPPTTTTTTAVVEVSPLPPMNATNETSTAAPTAVPVDLTTTTTAAPTTTTTTPALPSPTPPPGDTLFPPVTMPPLGPTPPADTPTSGGTPPADTPTTTELTFTPITLTPAPSNASAPNVTDVVLPNVTNITFVTNQTAIPTTTTTTTTTATTPLSQTNLLAPPDPTVGDFTRRPLDPADSNSGPVSDGTAAESGGSSAGTVAAVVIVLVVLAIGGVGGFVFWRKRQKRQADGDAQKSRDANYRVGDEDSADDVVVEDEAKVAGKRHRTTFAAGVDQPAGGPPRAAAVYNRKRRTTVSGPSTNLAETRSYRAAAHPKSSAEEFNLRRAMGTCQLFAQLDDDELGLLVQAMSRVDFSQGDFVTRQGDTVDAKTERFMVIASGEVSAIDNGSVLRVLQPWDTFNERHLMFVHTSCPLTHRVKSERCQCFALSADDYRHIVTRVAVDKSELYEGFLDRVEWLKGLSHREKIQLADSMQPLIFQDGEYLIEFDTVGHWLYLIVEGTVDVYGRRDGKIVRVCDFGSGDCVGELEFLHNHRTVADVRAKGRVKAARLHRDHFELCMGPIADVLRRTALDDEKYAYYRGVSKEHS